MGNNRINMDYIFYNYKQERVAYKGKYHYLSSDSNIYITVKAASIDSEETFDSILKTDFPIITVPYASKNATTYREYSEQVSYIIQLEKQRSYKKDDFSILDLHVNRKHHLQPHEAEAFYESSMSLVINGHEWDEYEDGIKPNHATYFEAPGYVFRELLPPGKIIDIVPAEYRLDYPLLHDENRWCSSTYISKECVDKAILYKRFKDPATIGTKEAYSAYTGKVETVELDFHNIDEEVLQVFIDHGVIRALDKPLDETEVAQQLTRAKEEAIRSQKEYQEWLINHNPNRRG